MKNYAIYYSYRGMGDVLVIIFNNSLSVTSNKTINNVTVVYHDEEVIGYNIFNIKDIVKIKSEGLIYYPSETFLNIINSILTNAKLETLEKKDNSGYFILEAKELQPIEKEKTLVTLMFSKKMINAIIKNQPLKIGDKVVVALAGTYLNDGEVVKEDKYESTLLNGHICTNKELGIKENEEELLILEEEAKTGEDFFLVEEHL